MKKVDFKLRTITKNGELLIKAADVTYKVAGKYSILSKPEYRDIEERVKRKGKINSSYYFNVDELFEFIARFEPEKGKEKLWSDFVDYANERFKNKDVVEKSFKLCTIVIDDELLIKTSSIHVNFDVKDTVSSIFHGGKAGTVNPKYAHIDESVRERGLIKGKMYFNLKDLFEFLEIYEPNENREIYAEFKRWCYKEFSVKKEKTVVRKQSYNIEIHHYDDGTVQMFRTNDGFHAIELLGICELAQSDIIEQLKGTVKVDKVVRTVVDRENGNN